MTPRNFEDILSTSTVRTSIATAHFLIFAALVLSLLLVQPSPAQPMGYFSFELLPPLAFWVLLIALAATSVLSIESNHFLTVPAIIVMMMAMRLPLLAMFKLPYNPDSYIYMGFIQSWHDKGFIDLSLDLRTQFWPVSFLLLYAFRQLGIGEVFLWSMGVLALYAVNAVLLYQILRRFLHDVTARYALLVISLAPTFNFYYYLTLSPQLVAATIFFLALLAFFEHEKTGRERSLLLYIGLFALLVVTHHLTTLLLIGYAFIMLLERPFASLLGSRIPITLDSARVGWQKRLLILSAGMFVTWSAYMAIIAQDFLRRFWAAFLQALAGKAFSYDIGGASPYSIGQYVFNSNALLVYGFRLLPLVIGVLPLLAMWIIQAIETVRSEILSPENLRVLLSTFFFGSLIVVSFFLLNGLFLEIPRMFDLTVLFSGAVAARWFTSKRGPKVNRILKGSLLLAVMAISSSIGMAVQSSEFVYYQDEREAITYMSGINPTATLYTDERLLVFAKFFAPNIEVRSIPQKLSDMFPSGPEKPSLVLISSHSIAYDRYRPLFGEPPSQVIRFLETNGRMIYANRGISVYSLNYLLSEP